MYLLKKRMVITDDFCNTAEVTKIMGIYLTEERAEIARNAMEEHINATFKPCLHGIGVVSRTGIHLEVKPLFERKIATRKMVLAK